MSFWLMNDLPQKQVPLGKLLATPGAFEALSRSHTSLDSLLARHMHGDWGEVGAEDWEANDQALSGGGQLLSAYSLSEGVRLWIITEWDRSATTVLLPCEY